MHFHELIHLIEASSALTDHCVNEWIPKSAWELFDGY